MQPADAALVIGIVGRHIVSADLVIEAVARPAHSRHHEVARFELGHIRTHSFNLSEALMPQYQDVVPVGSNAILGGIDLFIGTVDPDAYHAHEHSTSVGNVFDIGFL